MTKLLQEITEAAAKITEEELAASDARLSPLADGEKIVCQIDLPTRQLKVLSDKLVDEHNAEMKPTLASISGSFSNEQDSRALLQNNRKQIYERKKKIELLKEIFWSSIEYLVGPDAQPLSMSLRRGWQVVSITEKGRCEFCAHTIFD